jgi:hypothetical protein
MSDVDQLDEDALFDVATSDEPAPPPEPSPQPEPEPEPQPEPEPSAELQPEGQKPTAEDEASGRVPVWRVKEITEEKRRVADENERLKAELARLRQPQQQPQPQQVQQSETEVPDPILDPKGYAKHVRDEIRGELLAERREESMKAAREANTQAFDEAYQASLEAMRNGDVTIRARMQSSRDPGRTLLDWHKEQKAMREVGSDPNAWLEKKLEERLKDPAFLAKAVELARGSAPAAQQQNGRPRVELPPSLNGASRSNAQLRSAMNADIDDDALFDQTTG